MATMATWIQTDVEILEIMEVSFTLEGKKRIRYLYRSLRQPGVQKVSDCPSPSPRSLWGRRGAFCQRDEKVTLQVPSEIGE